VDEVASTTDLVAGVGQDAHAGAFDWPSSWQHPVLVNRRLDSLHGELDHETVGRRHAEGPAGELCP